MKTPQLSKEMMDNIICCPIDNTFRLIGKKFTIHILRNMMMQNQTRFNEFLETIEGMNPKTLSARLREMEKNNLIERKVFAESTPVRVEYFLTEKGIKVRSILEQMAAFSLQYCCTDVFKDGKPRSFKETIGTSPTLLK